MQHALLVALYLAGILDSLTGPLPLSEPCEVRDHNPFAWTAFTWSPAHQLTGVDVYTSDTLRRRSVLRWSGATPSRLEEDGEANGSVDKIYTFTWLHGLPVRMIRTNAPGASVTSGRVEWNWTWSADHRSARIASSGTYWHTVQTATFDAADRLLTLVGNGDADDRTRIELQWSADGRLVAQSTFFYNYRFTYDDRGRIATRVWTSPAYTDRYVYQCPPR